MASSFGKHLLENGVLGRHQLEEATQVMVVFGGRLGTILIEAGHLTVEEVEKHLAAYLNRPCAPEDRLARPDPAALDTISAEVARRYSVLPLWVEKRTLHAAMLDAHDPDCIDHLAFETGLSIAPYVVAERRLVELLERYYGIRPDPRFTDYRILEMAGHYRPSRRRGETSEVGEPQGSPDPVRADAPPAGQQELRERAALGIEPLQDGEELSDPSEFGLQHTDGGDGAKPFERAVEVKPPELSSSESPAPPVPVTGPRLLPAQDPSEVAQLEAELALLADRVRIAPIVLRIATYFARAAALFAVREEMIQGVAAAGEVRTEEIDGIYLPVESDNILARVVREQMSFRGRPQSAGMDGRIVRHLHVKEPKEAVVIPVCIDQLVVNLLYVDNGSQHLAEGSIAALEVLCEIMGTAYTRLILDSRHRHC